MTCKKNNLLIKIKTDAAEAEDILTFTLKHGQVLKKKQKKKKHTRAWIQFLSNPTNAGCLWLLSFKTNIIFFNYFYTITLEKSSPETWTHHTVPTGWVKLLMMSEKWEKWLRMLISGGLVPQLEHLSSADTTFCSDCSHHESPEVPPVSNVTLCLVVLGVGS